MQEKTSSGVERMRQEDSDFRREPSKSKESKFGGTKWKKITSGGRRTGENWRGWKS